MKNEQDRMIAILKGSYIAKYFPNIWYQQEQIKLEKLDKLLDKADSVNGCLTKHKS